MNIFNREKFNLDISDQIRDMGLSIFDIDYPSLSSKTLRVYLCRNSVSNSQSSSQRTSVCTQSKSHCETSKSNTNKKSIVSLEDCSRVSKMISLLLEEQQIEGADEWDLEVSSPGVNRKLRLLEHFQGAVGERVDVVFRSLETDQKQNVEKQNVTGVILKVEGDNIIIDREIKKLSKNKKGAKHKTNFNKHSKKDSCEANANLLCVSFSSIEEARVDFVF